MEYDLKTVLEDLYKSEINFEMSTFWDGGYSIRLGDNFNGYHDESPMLDNLNDVISELIIMTVKHFPDSCFSKKYNVVKSRDMKNFRRGAVVVFCVALVIFVLGRFIYQ